MRGKRQSRRHIAHWVEHGGANQGEQITEKQRALLKGARSLHPWRIRNVSTNERLEERQTLTEATYSTNCN